MAGRNELQHERVCTFMVASDKAQPSQNEIRTALESNDDEAKVHAMQKAISALLNGEQLPQLFITIVRYVLPSENHLVQKLLLLYLVSEEANGDDGGALGAGPGAPAATRRAAAHAAPPPARPLRCAGDDPEDRRRGQAAARDDPHLPEPAQQPAAPQRVHPRRDPALPV
jgi:hypothetical protein